MASDGGGGERNDGMATASYYLHSMFFMLSVYSFCVHVRVLVLVIYLIFKFLSLFPLMESAFTSVQPTEYHNKSTTSTSDNGVEEAFVLAASTGQQSNLLLLLLCPSTTPTTTTTTETTTMTLMMIIMIKTKSIFSNAIQVQIVRTPDTTILPCARFTSSLLSLFITHTILTC